MRISDWSSDVCSSDLQEARDGKCQHGKNHDKAVDPGSGAIGGYDTQRNTGNDRQENRYGGDRQRWRQTGGDQCANRHSREEGRNEIGLCYMRSEESREGKEGVRQCVTRWFTLLIKK